MMRLRSSDRVELESIMNFRKRGFRAMVLGLLVAGGLALAPAAFARSHVSVGVSVPGVSIGYGPAYGYYDYRPAYYYDRYYDPYVYDYGYYGPSVVYRSSYYPYRHHRYYYRDGHRHYYNDYYRH